MQKSEAKEVFELEKNLIGESSLDKILATLESDVLCYYVLKCDGKVVGFYEASIISPEAELYDIAVDKLYQGNGLSKLLMNHFISNCREENINTIFLEVNSINIKAISLYKSFGFLPYSVRKNYYGKNDAILMKLEI